MHRKPSFVQTVCRNVYVLAVHTDKAVFALPAQSLSAAGGWTVESESARRNHDRAVQLHTKLHGTSRQNRAVLARDTKRRTRVRASAKQEQRRKHRTDHEFH